MPENVVIVDTPVAFFNPEDDLTIINFFYPANPLPGEVVGNLINVPSGTIPEVLPNQYFAVEGGEFQGWRVIVRTPLRDNQPVTLVVTSGRSRLAAGVNVFDGVFLLSPVTGEILVSPIDDAYLQGLY